MIRARTVVALILCALLPAGCGWSGGPEPAAPTASPSGAQDTVSAAHPGDRLVVTATVAAVLTPESFLVSDIDLPENGLLIIGTAPQTLRRPDLVTIDGIVRSFDYARFAEQYLLGGPAWYEDYQGRHVLVADRVSSYA